MKETIDGSQVRRYLDELDSRLMSLPDTERHEIIREVEEHIHAERVAGHATSAILKELGSPEEVASATNQGGTSSRGDSTAYLILTTCLLLLGGFAIIGWFAGAILLWVGKSWTFAEKLICTLIWPGGLAAALIFFYIPTQFEGRFYPGGVYNGQPGNSPWSVFFGIAMFLVPIVVQGAILLLTLRRNKHKDF
ncbi:hypothetical protein QO003_002072 [Arthrobacter silviterrae]|uniref:DUF1700 domain-containing protein n=1 Tax=Arthrobacter silviterrae TaxID=2026658 RepID=A0ABX0DFA4_9MICC|nr:MULTISPECIES: DUF1700 domain-containing protein [Arthrobacter]MCU6482698.1 DUF1700 domain-containing protein [Arthrobacter sp. A2-55]MDQ0277769.1 hypothetical protein [Arthrobacter silviterrae]NGN85618.1 DUF1700 domain-containing protein [Arthrobacter silviterrae]